MISDDILVVYMTFADLDEAKAIGRVLVEERLIACINLMPQSTSLYSWNHAVKESTEVIAIAKTKADQFETIVNRVKKMHSYETPCIVAWPLAYAAEGYQQYLSTAIL